MIAPLWLDMPAPAPAGAPALTVLWHNVGDQVGEGRVPDQADAIIDTDVAILGRVDADVVQALDAGETLPHDLVYHDPGVGLVVLARVPVTGIRPVGPLPAGTRDTAVAFDAELAAGRSVAVLAMHTMSPRTPRRAAVRDAELAVAASWAGAQAGPAVVVGDLNTPPWSRQLRALARAGGLHDSSRGFQPTWPAPLGLVGVPIDHALHSPDLAVVSRTTGPGLGARHRSVRVTVAPTEPAPR
ncbi:MAG: endonuclease/exonuclease/phosphatase family protein [Egibacteraceae bacterium]